MHKVDQENPSIERYFFFTTDGDFVDGYQFEDREITHKMVPSRLAAYGTDEWCRQIRREARKKGLPDWKFPCYDLEEVVWLPPHSIKRNVKM